MVSVSVTDAGSKTTRAEKTRVAIADALLSLIDEGDLQPTATRIAERAGISLRLIYHHFGDLEALFQEASQREAVRLMARVKPVPLDLAFPERLEAFVEQRCSLLEWMTPVCRAAALHTHTSPTLQAAGVRGTGAFDRSFQNTFSAEIAQLPEESRAASVLAMSLITGWTGWYGMRSRGKSIEACRAAVRQALCRLLDQPI
jgi:TetR/AcrR family transcriptional regulator, regulator of autoinduction and epiphytic fitness